jgi:2-oxoglutarate ferredoxin oxidoreductase subunit delta
MSKGEIVIDEMYCRGCGYCADFCPKKCIVLSGDKFTSQGYALSIFMNPVDCNACKICGFMCPHHAIEVYRYVED